MTAENQSTIADFTFAQEGDETVSMDPDDPGCWSSGTVGVGTLLGCRYGVSAAEAISWLAPARVTAQTIATLPRDVAVAIFGARYFQAMSCDRMPGGIDLMVCDMGYNAGDATSVRLLQRLVGLNGDQVDGWAGPQTLAALAGYNPLPLLAGLSRAAARAVQGRVGVKQDGAIGPVTTLAVRAWPDRTFLVCAGLADAQLSSYEADAGWPKYGRGWTNRVWARLDAALALTPTEKSA